MDKEKKTDVRAVIAEQCIACGACSEDCLLLQEIDEAPAAIASRGATVDEAYACFLCGQCEAVCPLELNPKKMFADRRKEAVQAHEIDIEEFRYLFPDRPLNVMSMFRQLHHIDYQDLNQTFPGSVGFFPGCTMMTYAPALTRKVYDVLTNIDPETVFMTDCCGKPLDQLGTRLRAERNRHHLIERIDQLGIKLLVTACPNCYYELQQILREREIKVVTVYAILGSSYFQSASAGSRGKCTVHDSCPDRLQGVFGQQVRDALQAAGYEIIEMAHYRTDTFCCGSGGQVSHSRPDFTEAVIARRIQEAQDTGAEMLTAYCLSCVLNFCKNPSGLKVTHVLNLLLDVQEDYDGLKRKAQGMFDGPEGEERWQQIMAEPERTDEDE